MLRENEFGKPGKIGEKKLIKAPAGSGWCIRKPKRTEGGSIRQGVQTIGGKIPGCQ